jgi:putative restriction endonuclease
VAKAIFTIKTGSGYDDDREDRYHFPRTYLNQVQASLGDGIIYYEPRRSEVGVGRMSYFAMARVVDVSPDRHRPDHFYAHLSDYLDFDKPVPFTDGVSFFENGLRKDDGSVNKGAFGRAVRLVSEAEFDLILRTGFAAEITPPSYESHLGYELGFSEPQVPFERPIVEMTVARPFRDRAFRTAVRTAYGNRCAVTGLQLINGGGRPEVEAAHIRPVSQNGPDAIRNGIALSQTFHWLFDRGMISIRDDYRILVSDSVPTQARQMINQDGALILPDNDIFRPSPNYLRFHRDNIFKK